MWQTAAIGTVTVANGNSAGQSAALIANGSLVNGALYRVTATYNDGSVTCLLYTSIVSVVWCVADKGGYT